MDKPSTLAQVIAAAAKRHNAASGRRLAEIAQSDGFTLSHATVNRLRRGEIGTISQPTIEAVAHLAGLDADLVRTIAVKQQGAGQSPEMLAREYTRVNAELHRVVFDYADARGIDVGDAIDELDEVRVMAAQLKDGRPWTPPWEPLPDEFLPGDQPWIEAWWTPAASAAYRRRRDERLRDRLYGRPSSVPASGAQSQADENKEAMLQAEAARRVEGHDKPE